MQLLQEICNWPLKQLTSRKNATSTRPAVLTLRTITNIIHLSSQNRKLAAYTITDAMLHDKALNFLGDRPSTAFPTQVKTLHGGIRKPQTSILQSEHTIPRQIDQVIGGLQSQKRRDEV